MSLEKTTYDPAEIEQHWYEVWEKNGDFKPSGKGAAYSIMLPPPNVTGSLHMGHGFLFTLIDVLIRYHRMSGDNTLWQGGTDHAGIATQMVVERQLNAAGQSRHEIGREAFTEKVWQWKSESGGQICRQLRRLGASIDWTRERFTMDENFTHAVRKVFIDLYAEGLIYRGKRLVNWDPVLLTAVSDLEVVNTEEEGKLWHIHYPIKDSNEQLTVATTRPETLFGDVAVAVHPDDKRYQKFIGKEVMLPLSNRAIPIIADEYVDPLFGSGCVKITPAHDFNDYAIGERHQLTPINILTPNAHLNENVPPDFQGLERFVARKKVISALKALNLLAKEEKHPLKIPRGDRSNAVIEPYLTYQWYVKSKVLAKDAIQVVRSGKVKFIPENWDKTYFQWMENIEDWCISRQLWWGHRIPVWYDKNANIYVGFDEQDARTRYKLSSDVELTQEEDVLDTWFSSALWPMVTLGWPQKTPEFDTYFPTAVLVTGFDIIFFWVARMIMMSLKFTGKVPFHEVYITGLIRDAEGQKMSKTKGNVLDPIDLIDGVNLEDLTAKRIFGLMQPAMAKKITEHTKKEFPHGIKSYGTDALRFTFCSFASYTREIRFDINRLTGYRNFCNKIWNATRYILMQIDHAQTATHSSEHSVVDQWILSRLQKTIDAALVAFKEYRFDLLAQTLYDFTWNEFCDWYLEFSKPILSSGNRETQKTLVTAMTHILRLLHPIIPFITEELWHRMGQAGSVSLATYPKPDQSLINTQAENEIEWLKAIIINVRTIRSEMQVSPAKTITLLFKNGSDEDKINLEKHAALLKTLAKVSNVSWLATHEAPPASASAFVGKLEIYLPLGDLIDRDAELSRLQKEKAKINKEIESLEKKIANPEFLAKAPKAVVDKQKHLHTELRQTLAKIDEQLGKL